MTAPRTTPKAATAATPSAPATPKAEQSAVIMIGVVAPLDAIIAAQHTGDSVAATPRPFELFEGTDEEKALARQAARLVQEADEAAALTHAMNIITKYGKRAHVYVDGNALGSFNANGKRITWPTVVAPDAWRQVGGFARTAGAQIHWT